MKLQEWKDNGCNYQQGVALYAAHPKHNKNLLRLFLRKENAANLQKLKYELGKLPQNSCDNPPEPALKSKKVSSKVVSPANPTPPLNISTSSGKLPVYFHQLPPELRETLLEANVLFKECCFLKVSLNELRPEQEVEALELQLRIAANMKRNQQCWKRIDYYLNHKVILKEAKPKDFAKLSPAKQVYEMQLLESSISKLKKRLNKNLKELSTPCTTREKNRLERAITKQEANIFSKESDLQILKSLIHE